MFTGQGSQYVNMARELYQTERTFKQECDRCCELLQAHLGWDLRSCLYPTKQETETATQRLQQTAITQPALFVIEYALAKLWMSWGVIPEAMIGHSIGEYVAATLAGVFSLEDALSVVVTRGLLMQQLPKGAMLSVSLSKEEVLALLGSQLSLAATNSPSLSVVSGSIEAVEQFAQQLASKGVDYRRLHTSHAFHSEMIDSIVEPFTEYLRKVNLNKPQIAFISNVTGTWITPKEATDPSYWAQHLRQRVKFSEGIACLVQDASRIFLEVGAGRTLSTLAKQQASKQVVLSSLPHFKDEQSDARYLLNTLGKLWLAGVSVDWLGFYAQQKRDRLPLPTYPFERQRYWIEPPSNTSKQTLTKKPDCEDWFYIPSWKRSIAPAPIVQVKSCYLIFLDECGLGVQLVKHLQNQNQEVITVKAGSEFAELNPSVYTLHPQQRHDYDALLKALITQQKIPKTIVHLWTLTNNEQRNTVLESVDRAQETGFYSLLFLTQAIGKQNLTDDLQITVISNNLQEVTQEEILSPEKATLLGIVKTIPQEYPNINCCSVDVVLSSPGSRQEGKLINQLLTEITALTSDTIIAYRGSYRWVQSFEPVQLNETLEETPRLREKGVYLITGGLGGIGLVLAEHLAKTVQAKLILVGRSALPKPDEWLKWLATHDKQDSISQKISKVLELQQIGAEVLVISADVSDLEQMQMAIAQAQKQFDQINGVIHAAGVPGGGVIQRKTIEEAEDIFAPKVKGTLVLDTIFNNVQLDFLILCSSLASVLGGFGQVDYASANAFLDAFSHYKNSTNGTFTTCINWNAWQEVGMAAVKQLQPQIKAVTHPLFDQCLVENSDQEIYTSKLNVSKHWVLNEHRLKGKAILPGTAYLEMARAAWENYTDHQYKPIELQEVYFFHPLIVEDWEEKEVLTILKKKEDSYEFSIVSKSNIESEQWQQHAVGEILELKLDNAEKVEIPEIEKACHKIEQRYKPPEGFIDFGARWNNLKWIKTGSSQGLALLELSEVFITDLKEYQLHPALLDFATGFMMMQLKEEGTAYLPFSYKSLKIKGNLPQRIYSYIETIESPHPKTETLKFNIIIMDEQGTKLVEIAEYTLRKFNDIS